MKAIIGAKIILEKEILEGKAIVFEDKIRDICDLSKMPAEAEIIDACGNYAAPGLIDVHIHGFLGEDASDCSPEGIKTMSEGLARQGVTGFLPTTVTIPREDIQNAADITRSLMGDAGLRGAAVLGMHAEGPFVNPKKKGAQNEAYIQAPDASLILENSDVIKIVTLAPEMDEGFSAVREIVRNSNTVVSMGHTDASYEEACEAVLAGVSHSTHLFNAMSVLAHRAPGVVGASLNKNISTEIICDMFHIHPALYKIVYACKKDKLVLITDCVRSGGLTDGEYMLGGQKVILKGIECRLEDGTIAGSVLTLNKGVYNFYCHAGVSLCEAVNCASLNPARLIGLDKQKGSIEAGKDADIIIADAKFNIKRTIIGGRIVY